VVLIGIMNTEELNGSTSCVPYTMRNSPTQLLPRQASSSQSGQVAVVILLIMVVLLTVGLSLATRTTEELFLSQQQAESARVFNAAETGIEDALSQDFNTTIDPRTFQVDGVDVSYTVTGQNTLQTRITEGMSAQVNLVGYIGPVTVQWATEEDCNDRASLIATIFYDSGGTTQSRHIAFGPPTTCVNHNDNFLQGSNISTTYKQQYVISAGDIPAGSAFMRIKPVYADTNIRVTGGLGFPTQTHLVHSTATYGSGNEERSIEVTRTLPAGPSFMDYALYSGGSITQNAP
jgi:Tfp pilus assembly protein PilX